jgi:inner membrane transporter RhtA
MLLAVRRPSTDGWSAARWRDVSVLGLAGAMSAICFYLSVDHLPFGTAATIDFLGPLAVALFSGRGRGHLLAAALALAGVALVSSATPSGDAIGFALALGAALGWGLYILASRRVGRYGATGDNITVAMCAAGIACLPLSIGAVPHLGLDSTLAVLLLVTLLGRVVPYRLELAALRRVRTSTAGVLFSIEPAIAALIGAISLGQSLSVAQVAGILTVVLAGSLVLRDAPVDGGFA